MNKMKNESKMLVVGECKEHGFLVQSYDEKEVIDMMKLHLKMADKMDLSDKQIKENICCMIPLKKAKKM